MPDLYPFQERGARWLATKRVGYLADEMGLGKTVQAIRAFDEIGALGGVVICPAIMRHKWAEEFEKFGRLKRNVGVVTKNTRFLPDLAIASYEGAEAFSLRLARIARTVVVDEARALKDRNAARTKAVYDKLAPAAERFWLLDGTPAPNHPAELFAFLRHAGVWKRDYWDFVTRFCKWRTTQFGVQITGSQNEQELDQMLRPVMLRRTEAEAEIELPPLAVEPHALEPDAAAVDPSIAAELAAREPAAAALVAEAEKTGDWSLGAAEHLATIRRLLGMLKAPSVVKLARHILQTERKIAIYGVHRDVLGYIASELIDMAPVLLTGDANDKVRHAGIKAFQSPGGRTRVVIGQMHAAGAGVTLTAARTLILAEPSFVPGDNRQVIKRIHRIGQHAPCRALIVSAKGTLDESINRVLERKTKSIANFIRPS